VNASEGKSNERQPSALVTALLADYAAGALAEPFAVLVAAYRQMQGRGSAPAPLAQPVRARASTAPSDHAAFDHAASDQSSSSQIWDQISAIMPLALRSYVARQHGAFETLEWHALLPGIERCWISRADGGDAYLLRCRPGSAILKHSHAGREVALVLQGGFRDVHGRYRAGEIAVADHTVEHRPVADRGEVCIIFVVLDAPIRLTGLLGRLIQRIFRV